MFSIGLSGSLSVIRRGERIENSDREEDSVLKVGDGTACE